MTLLTILAVLVLGLVAWELLLYACTKPGTWRERE